jgi:3-mercaptopyruvate sulfurtransferase SseA
MTLFAALGLGVALFAGPGRADEGKTHAEGFSELTIDQVSDLIAKRDADVFDNNSRDVFAKGHLPTAKWVKFNEVHENDLPSDKSHKLIFYCANTH